MMNNFLSVFYFFILFIFFFFFLITLSSSLILILSFILFTIAATGTLDSLLGLYFLSGQLLSAISIGHYLGSQFAASSIVAVEKQQSFVASAVAVIDFAAVVEPTSVELHVVFVGY